MADFTVIFRTFLFSLVICDCVADTRGCSAKYFGWKCKFRCACIGDESCDKETGACPNGCKEDRYGPSCLLDSNCFYDKTGINYMGNKHVNKDGTECLKWSDPRVIKAGGYKEDSFPDNSYPNNFCRNPRSLENGWESGSQMPWCYILKEVDGKKEITYSFCRLFSVKCMSGRFGDNCLEECHCRNETEACDAIAGTCKSGCHAGWLGASCKQQCHPGKYGIGCKNECTRCKDKACNHETGNCLHGCQPGFYGPRCEKVCAENRFGANCQHECGHCQFERVCDRVTGSCPDGCKIGYSGISCSQACRSHHYGQRCENRCGYCSDEKPCDRVTGKCTAGCASGWMGSKCAQPCEKGLFGPNCTMACGKCKGGQPCDRYTGICVEGCDSDFSGSMCLKSRSTGQQASAAGGAIGAILLLVLCVGIVAFILYRKKRFHKVLRLRNEESDGHLKKDTACVEYTTETDQLLCDYKAENTKLKEKADNEFNEDVTEPIYVNVNKKQHSPVPIDELPQYILKNKENECAGFKTEYEELPQGILALCHNAKKPENKLKNRYGNIIAYDHSRVVLKKLSSDPGSDYVNANYIEGYNKPKSYIASQGPTKAMLRDFWRMIWQEKIYKIVMLTNLVEACKKKCEQYWPDKGKTKYGDVTVENIHTTKYTDFTIRTFKIMSEENSRIVKQFHFTAWPDHGAPTYATTILNFKRKVMMYNPDSSGPILIHCSAGIGRTGSFIALDYLLMQARAEKLVDVLGYAQLMRANRVNMIQTLEQYVFVYEALLEAILAKETTIQCSAYRDSYESLITPQSPGNTNPLEEQFEVLQQLTMQLEREDCAAAMSPANLPKNRFKNVLPANRCRPYLYTNVEGCNDYINAVFLPGYTQREAFIVTQMPLANTVADFWRMLYDYGSDTVIMLNEFDRNDKTCALYWPEEYGYCVEHGPLSIELLSSSDADTDYTVRIFRLNNLVKGEERAVKQFQFKSWPDFKSVPDTSNSLLRLYEKVHDWLEQNGKGPATIHCMNGASKSGLLCALIVLFERIRMDKEVDVFQTIRALRVSRPQFIDNFEQFQFCYQMALEYMDQENHK